MDLNHSSYPPAQNGAVLGAPMAYVNLEGQKGRSAGAFVLQRLDLQLGLAKLAENCVDVLAIPRNA